MSGLRRLRAAGRLGEDVALGPLTTYRFGGPARYLVTIDGEQDLQDAFEIATDEGLPLLPLGRGSNIVVADAGFPGVVLRAGQGLSHRSIGEESVAGAAVQLPMLAGDGARGGDQMEMIIDRAGRDKVFTFSSLLPEHSTLRTLVVTFLAILELVRMKRISVTQNAAFTDIHCRSCILENGLETPDP